MTQKRKLTICAAVVLHSVLACLPLQSATVPSSPSAATAVQTIEPTEPAGLFRQVASLAGLLPDDNGNVQVRALDDGTAWIIMDMVAMQWDGQEWEFVLSESDEIQAAVDNGGRLWVLRQNTSGITAWQDGQWTTYDDESGWMDEPIFGRSWWATAPWSMNRDAAGTLWLPMTWDVRAFDGNRWTLYTMEDMGFPPLESEDLEIVHQIAIRGGTEVWVGECYYSGPGPMGGQGARWFDGMIWHGAEAPVGTGCVSALNVDPAGNVWLGAGDAIWRYEPATQVWTPYYLPGELLSDYNFTHPQQLIVDQTGDVWVIMLMCGGASCSGPLQLFRIHAGEWSLIFTEQDFSSSLKQLALDGSGMAWLFWEGTVYRLEPEYMEPVGSIEARGVDVSPDGRVWVVAGYGDDSALWVMEP